MRPLRLAWREPRFWLGWLLLCDYLVVFAVKWKLGALPELLWISHVSLPLAGLALILGSDLLLTSTLILIFVPHVLWLGDFLAWAITGHSPLGITGYLGRADAWLWIGTHHHFFMLPLMLVLFVRRPFVLKAALPLAAVLFVLLALSSRLFLPIADNVNYAFCVLPGTQFALVRAIDHVPAFVYFPGMIVFMILVFLTPTTLLLQGWAGHRLTPRLSSPPREAGQLKDSAPVST